MDTRITDIQARVLAEAAKEKDFPFALAGGTALERYYLHHRFSRDLDFFTPGYDPAGAERFVKKLSDRLACTIRKDQEFIAVNRARVIFYSLSMKGAKRPLKMDFVEDVLIERPAITRIGGVPVYSVKDIYFHKIVAVAGSEARRDAAGRVQAPGRDEPRDAFDLYALSVKVTPLHEFLLSLPRMYQRRFVRWARTYSRFDMKVGLVDLEIHLKDFDARKMISHIDDEVREFVGGIR